MIHRNAELINPEFLNNYLNRIPTRTFGETAMSRSINQSNIDGTKPRQYPIYLPNLRSQQGIVGNLRVLESETKLLESFYQKKLTSLAELKQSLFKKAFPEELTKDPILSMKEAAA